MSEEPLSVGVLIHLLERAEKLFGLDDPDTLSARNQLARAYVLEGEPRRAIPLYETSVVAMERVLGSDDPRTVATRENLAFAIRLGDQPD